MPPISPASPAPGESRVDIGGAHEPSQRVIDLRLSAAADGGDMAGFPC